MTAFYHDTPIPSTKTCRVCGFEKSAEQFEPYSLVCKACRIARKKQLSYERQQTVDAANTFKVCTKCHQEKALNEFYRQSNNTTGYTPRCKVCDDERKQQWNHDNAEHVGERKKQYKREKMPNYQGEYYQKNRDHLIDYAQQYYEEHKEVGKPQRKAWQQDNLLACRESNDRRRAHKQKTSVARVSYKRILKRDGYFCYICEDSVAPDQVSFDHVIPLDRHGTHTEDNIKVAHKVCNCRKRTRLLEEMTPFQRRGVR